MMNRRDFATGLAAGAICAALPTNAGKGVFVANLGGAVDDTFLKGTGAKLYADKPEMNDDPYRYYRW